MASEKEKPKQQEEEVPYGPALPPEMLQTETISHLEYEMERKTTDSVMDTKTARKRKRLHAAVEHTMTQKSDLLKDLEFAEAVSISFLNLFRNILIFKFRDLLNIGVVDLKHKFGTVRLV